MFIDVSHLQGAIDWAKVASNIIPIEGVYIKATQGVNFLDPHLVINSQGANSNGIKIGYYHFASLDTSDVVTDATNEANWFIANVKKCAVNTLPLVLDMETNKASLPKDKILLWAQTFFARLGNLGYSNYMLYSYTPFLDVNLPADHNLGNIPLWIAAYSSSYKLPHGWSKAFMWQYSANGSVQGITTHVDLNKLV
jgi:lysozyme